MKKLFVKTYGCQMNVYDSARISELLGECGYADTHSVEDADLVVLNTCHIREKAAEKVYSELGRLRRLKHSRGTSRPLRIAVAGCVAQAEGEEIFARQHAVDIVVGPQSYHRLPQLLAEAEQGAPKGAQTEFPVEDKFASLPEERMAQGACAFLTVQEGCDRFCSFCVVPYTRGAEFSRPVAQIENEARSLMAKGAVEITLLGQNVNAYRGEGPDGTSWTLARLLSRLGEIDGLARLRYTTSHPRDMSDDLIAAHREIENLMPYLHLPVQTGSDRILAAMNRQHTVSQYRKIVETLRRTRPDIALSSDFIVGFPGESDDDFEATLALVREIEFAQAFSFKYSARPGTPAASASNQVPDDVKSQRLYALQALLDAQQFRFNRACAGKTLSVLFEKPGRRQHQAVGRSPWLQPVHVDNAAHLVGSVREVTIAQAGPNSLHGVLPREGATEPVHTH